MPNGHRRVGLRPGTPVPSDGLRPANGVPVPVQCCIVCILGADYVIIESLPPSLPPKIAAVANVVAAIMMRRTI